jgi:hypothetical protein
MPGGGGGLGRGADPAADKIAALVLWSFYSPDAAALADELKQIRELADGPQVTHLAGGVHATAEPVQTLDAGWDMAAIGEGESTLLSLVDAKGDPTGITGLAYRDAAGDVKRTGKAKQRDLNDFPGFALKWDRFNALEITRGCIYACRFQRQLPPVTCNRGTQTRSCGRLLSLNPGRDDHRRHRTGGRCTRPPGAVLAGRTISVRAPTAGSQWRT